MSLSSSGLRNLAAGMVLICVVSGLPTWAQAKKTGNPAVVITTSKGDFTVELFQDQAPKTVANFLSYVQDGFYRGTIFHRILKGRVVQGGGLTADMKRKPTKPPITNEAANGLKNVRGTLAMARTADVNSATAQFFINMADNTPYDHRGPSPDAFGYAVFAKVIAGMSVVEQIESVPTGNNNAPLQPVVIKNVRLK
jgi:peptidyl-prolyl cis-trans isomerase A (cyclophilin A)